MVCLWYHDVRLYMQTGDFPKGSTNNSRKTLRRLATQFFLVGEILFKRIIYGPLHCLEAEKATKIMEELHEGTYGPHMNNHALSRKIIHTGY